MFRVDQHQDKSSPDRVRHVLTINSPGPDDVSGSYLCRAENSAGVTEKIINVKGIVKSRLSTESFNSFVTNFDASTYFSLKLVYSVLSGLVHNLHHSHINTVTQ